MKLSALLAPLIAAKADHATIMDVVLAFEAEQTDGLARRRENDAKRQAEKRKRDESHVMSRDVTVTVSSHASASPAPDLENKQTNKQGRKQDTAPVARSDLADFKSELSSLDPERVEAIVKHRRSKHGQLTALSARLFVADAKSCGLSLADAVDTCISRNWITVKPEYLAGRRQQSAQAPPHQGDGYNAVLNKIINGNSDEHAGPTIDASYDRADRGGSTNLVQFDALSARNRT